jgi:ferredoxin
MKPETINLIYFSPTATTRTILKEIARGTGFEIASTTDITSPETRKQPPFEPESGIVMFGAPVYGGRLPHDAAMYFKKISGAGQIAIPVVVYGNRAFEDALLELENITADRGFFPVAAAAFIGEHSFASKQIPIALERPDADDLKKAFEFGRKIAALIDSVNSPEKELSRVEVPGSFPYKKAMPVLSFPFIEVRGECDRCGICVSVCPNEAIDESAGYATIDEKCIHCCACIKSCPAGARILKDSPFKEKAIWMSKNCKERKEPEMFVAQPC